MFVGVLALAGLALVACEPAQAPPDSPPPELPQICIPDNTGDPRALPEPAPTAPVARRSACRARKISRRRPTSRGSSSNGSRRCAC